MTKTSVIRWVDHILGKQYSYCVVVKSNATQINIIITRISSNSCVIYTMVVRLNVVFHESDNISSQHIHTYTCLHVIIIISEIDVVIVLLAGPELCNV